MVEAVITFLILAAVIVGVFYLVTWALGEIGVNIPERVMRIAWVIVVLVVVLLAWRSFSPLLGLRF